MRKKNAKFIPSVMTDHVFIHPSTRLFLPKQKERTKENRVQRVLYIEFFLMERVVFCNEMKWNEMK